MVIAVMCAVGWECSFLSQAVCQLQCCRSKVVPHSVREVGAGPVSGPHRGFRAGLAVVPYASCLLSCCQLGRLGRVYCSWLLFPVPVRGFLRMQCYQQCAGLLSQVVCSCSSCTQWGHWMGVVFREMRRSPLLMVFVARGLYQQCPCTSLKSVLV